MILPSSQARAVIARMFDLITFRLGAFLIFLTTVFVPLGQHRLWLRIGGWWLYPATASLTLFAITETNRAIETQLWARLMCFPLGLLYIFDFWLIVLFAKVPVSSKAKGSKA